MFHVKSIKTLLIKTDPIRTNTLVKNSCLQHQTYINLFTYLLPITLT